MKTNSSVTIQFFKEASLVFHIPKCNKLMEKIEWICFPGF